MIDKIPNTNLSPTEFLELSQKEQAKLYYRHGYPLSGYTDDTEAKVSIWGKLLGYDPDFDKSQIDDLKKFIDESGGLAIEHLPYLRTKLPMFDGRLMLDNKTTFTVDELKSQYPPMVANIIFKHTPSIKMLDSDMSVEDFKAAFARHTLKERFNVELNDEDAKNALNILKELKNQDPAKLAKQENKSDDKFKPIQAVSKSVTYKDEASSEYRKFYEFIQREFNSGKNVFEILKKVADSRVDKLA
ncbi:hypothetical protein [Campylobacter sp. 19-13652]|uniref:hypothetical protein n=1 Tax=Campylobacter sp. 19-13652 TaxID=2840180 RepID=UPI001C860A6A|nr:hypothetical protein [Campylobacter sp. 19-13652]